MRIFSSSELFGENETVRTWAIEIENYCEKEHIHEFLELVYTYSGSVHHKIDGISYTAKEGDMVFINPGQIHYISSASENTKIINLILKPQFFGNQVLDRDTFYDIFRFFLSDPNEKICIDSQSVSFKKNDLPKLNTLFRYMLEETKNTPTDSMSLTGYTYIIFSMLLTALKAQNSEEIYPKNMIFKLIDYINQNYDKNITLSTLSEKCYYSPQYISREFKKFYGKGVKEYLIEKRITSAAKFLLETDLSVDEIREKVSFSDKTKFFKEFYKKFSCTPSEYRKKLN